MVRELSIVAACGALMLPCLGHAQSGFEPETPDRFELIARGETYVELFSRALLPGPSGALVSSSTQLPIHQYVSLRALDVDTALGTDTLDVELSAWGRGFFGNAEATERIDGDVQSANVRIRRGPLSARLGRQLVAGGAARYARFDGARVGATFGAGLDAELYGGLTVLPRWNARPGYHHLGAAADTLLVDPEALPEPDRSGHWLAGGRVGYAGSPLFGGLSFHEQHESRGLVRRNLGADARYHASTEISAGGVALFELDASRLADARLWLDTTPLPQLDVSGEVRRTEPSLYLSRQSVLSVFSTDGYAEAGSSVVFRALDDVTVDGEAFVQAYEDSRNGARGDLGVRVTPGVAQNTIVRVGYGRVLAVDNGYHSLRASLMRRMLPELTGTLELYAYLYDEAIERRTTSTVYAATLGYQATDALHVLWGNSIAQSPYASFDAQTLLRLVYDFDLSVRRAGR